MRLEWSALTSVASLLFHLARPKDQAQSASLGTGKADKYCADGGFLCLLLLPEVGCSMF